MAELYQVLKLDLDITVKDDWLRYWIYTRVRMLDELGVEVTDTIIRPSSKKGYHVWFHLKTPISYDKIGYLRFLCGDDYTRLWFHQQRKGFKNRKYFDLLFSEKRPIEGLDNAEAKINS